MYSNYEGLGTPIREMPHDDMWENRSNARNTINACKRMVRCICPRCRETIYVFMMWSGRGMPRKFCADCKSIINAYDETAIFESSPEALVPAKRRGSSVSED